MDPDEDYAPNPVPFQREEDQSLPQPQMGVIFGHAAAVLHDPVDETKKREDNLKKIKRILKEYGGLNSQQLSNPRVSVKLSLMNEATVSKMMAKVKKNEKFATNEQYKYYRFLERIKSGAFIK